MEGGRPPAAGAARGRGEGASRTHVGSSQPHPAPRIAHLSPSSSMTAREVTLHADEKAISRQLQYKIKIFKAAHPRNSPSQAPSRVCGRG
jgi:hypothetical protein